MDVPWLPHDLSRVERSDSVPRVWYGWYGMQMVINSCPA